MTGPAAAGADGPAAIPPAIQGRGTELTDAGAVALAVAVVVGAWWHGPIPLLAGVGAVTVAWARRRPWLLVVGGLVLAAGLGQRAMAGLDPVAPAPYRGPVTLLADPSITPYGVRVDVRAGRQRVELEGTGAEAGTVGRARAGERLRVEGRLRPPPPDAPWLVPRHVVGRLVVNRAESLDGGSAPWRAANRFRRLLARGSDVLPEPARSLYGGFVLGDDRGQTPAVVDDFRGAGLTHLLVVSGQNVAFVLVLASPVTTRLGLGGRWAVTLGIIGAFAVLTRFEPSVLRASAMAALAVTASLAGRPAATVRTLALAVSGLVLIDPLLVWSVGFQLSVAASLGIAVLGPPIAARLSGPTWWRDALGVTLAAQLGVAPVLVPRFGGLPVVSIVANVLTVPVAGLVTTWGLPAGLVAGLAGPGVARVVHLPTRLLIGWVAGVARVAASVPLGEVGAGGLAAAAAGGWIVLAVARWRPRWWLVRLVGVALMVVALVGPAVALQSPPFRQQVARGTIVYRSSGATAVVLVGSPPPRVVLEGLRRAGVRRVDILVVPRDPGVGLMGAIRHRWSVVRVLALDAVGPVRLRVGGLLVDTTVPEAPTVTPIE